MTKLKYPRTFHMPFSMGRTSDDKVLKNLDHLHGKKVVLTTKMDGENTTLGHDYTHARSLDSANHPSRNWVKAFHATLDIPEEFRVCGENLYARHSIEYDSLPSYFMGFSMWHNDYCLPWDSTLEWFELIGITSVSYPVLRDGTVVYPHMFDEEFLHQVINDIDTDQHEGIVLRTFDGFAYNDFGKHVCKWVRQNHVQTDTHWMHAEIVPNTMKGSHEV